MDLDAIKRRIKALSAMTTERGASEAEALNAARLMADLLRENGLTVADIEATRKTDANTVGQEAFDAGNRVLHDVVRCAMAIAEFFDCRAWASKSGGRASIVFFGFPQDTAAASAMAALVRDAMEREWSDYWRRAKATSPVSGRSARTSFMAGMGSRVSARLRQMKREANQAAEAARAAERVALAGPPAQAASAGAALVVVKAREINRAFAALNLRLGSGSGRSAGYDGAARAAGAAAGDRVNLGGATRQIT